MHVHVAVDDAEKAIQVVNGLLNHLSQMLALSASSPFWRGEPTGLASSRQMVFAAFPRSGPPPRFKDYADYAEVVGQLEKTGCIADYTHIWWDIRLHPRLGTVEMRVCDAVTRLEDVVAITSFYQALVKMYCEEFEAGRYHSLAATSVPDELEISATCHEDEVMAVRHRSLPVDGVQFHPESVLTPVGPALARNFLEAHA